MRSIPNTLRILSLPSALLPRILFSITARHLFTQIPLILTAVEQRRIQFSDLPDSDTVIAVSHDFRLSFETILRVLPGTERIVVLNGTSPNEKFWLGELRKDAASVQKKVEFIWPNDISFQDFLKKSETLPPKTAIFWHLMNVDATGVLLRGEYRASATSRGVQCSDFFLRRWFFWQ